MQIVAVLQTAFGAMQLLNKAAAASGLLGKHDDVMKYLSLAADVGGRAVTAVKELLSNPNAYDTMSADDIRALLLPKQWDELEAKARAELVEGK